MAPPYSILAGCENPAFCAVYELPDSLPKPIRAARGLPMAALCPDDLELRMADAAPGLQIADAIDNALGYLLVSDRLRGLLDSATHHPIEFLPFTLIDHKGRIASTNCVIANVLVTIDGIDRPRSEGVDHPLYPGEYLRLLRLAIRPDAIPDDATIFRLATRPEVILVRDDLRATIDGAGLHVNWFELGTEVLL